MFLIGKSGLCIFHRHFFADRMHNWLFPLFLWYIFILLGSPDKPGGLSIQLCKSEKKEFYIRYSS